MNMKNRELRAELAAMRIAPTGAAVSFEQRLAREQDWSASRTARVMEEYRRFLYLAATEGAAVTPCKAVDAAWHLHLTYTRHYWDELCGRILAQPLHHEPSAGDAQEEARLRDQYRATCAAYERAFGEVPPPDLWSDPKEEAVPMTAVTRSPRVRRVLPALTSAVAGTALLAACTTLAAAARGQEEEDGPVVTILAYLLLAGIVYWVVRAVRRRRKSGKGRRTSDSGDSSDFHDSDGGASDGGASSCGGGGD